MANKGNPDGPGDSGIFLGRFENLIVQPTQAVVNDSAWNDPLSSPRNKDAEGGRWGLEWGHGLITRGLSATTTWRLGRACVAPNSAKKQTTSTAVGKSVRLWLGQILDRRDVQGGSVLAGSGTGETFQVERERDFKSMNLTINTTSHMHHFPSSRPRTTLGFEERLELIRAYIHFSTCRHIERSSYHFLFYLILM